MFLSRCLNMPAALPSLALCFIALQQPREIRAQAAELYQFDVAHALFEFNVRLVGFNRVRGVFESYRGDVLFLDDDPARSAVTLVIDVKSIRTGTKDRDAHLQKSDFFDADRWPHIKFASTRIEKTAEGYVAVGPLTIRDVTREVRVPFKIIAPKSVDPFGNTRFSTAGRLTLNRRDYDVIGPPFWNRAISDSVEIEFEIPGRRWKYSELGFGPQTRPNGGRNVLNDVASKGLKAAIDAGWQQFTTHRADTTYNFAPFEYQKAAGRLADEGKRVEAIAVLELGIRIAAALERHAGRANLHAQLAEVLLGQGDRHRSLEQARMAAQVDPSNTAAQLLIGYLSTAAPSTKATP
jgi:polyisoprenoid-binding protein YceI